MKQIDLVEYLEQNGCEIVRLDNKGYYVIRNIETRKISGVPLPSNGSQIKAPTVCHICRNLGVEVPDCAKEAENIIDEIRLKHNRK